VALLLAVAGLAAWADEAPRLPFVDERGMVSQAPTYADMERALGEPATATIRPEGWTTQYPRFAPTGRQSGKQVRTGGELDADYPMLGLRFTVDREDRPGANPPIRLMTISAPAAGRTAQGLYIGQPLSEAVAIARRHYKVLQERLEGDRGALELVDATGSSPHRMWLELRGGALHQMQFDFKPPPSRARSWLAAAALLVAVGAVAWAIARWREGVAVSWPVASDRTAAWVGKLLVWGGLAVAVASMAGLGLAAFLVHESGNPYGGLGGLVVGNYAIMGLLLALVLIVVGRRIVRSAAPRAPGEGPE
jgi:hypothetical protein